MDSMRSLNKSLPSASKKQPSPQPDLLQAFRSAALTVTNLYKTAAADQAKTHAEGYQEALQDLIGFLDKENLGLGDGEGWSVRQWATERLDGQLPTHSTSDEEEEHEDKRARSSSPVMERKQSPELVRSSPPRAESPRPGSAPPASIPDLSSSPNIIDAMPPRADFTFRSSHAYPSIQDTDMETISEHSSSHPSVRVGLVPRRNGNRQQRNSTRSGSNMVSLGNGAGMKRRLPISEYFDVSGVWNDRKDGSGTGGGSKRGRFA